MNGRIKIQRVRGGKMNKTLFVFLVGIGIAAAQNPTPDQARQIELQKEAMRRAEAQAQAFTILGFPMLNPARPVPILWPPLNGERLIAAINSLCSNCCQGSVAVSFHTFSANAPAWK